MKVGNTAGLVGAGGVNQSFLSRMPSFLGCLGPVKGSTLRVSRRIANAFRAGLAVTEYAELGDCKLIWIFAPENTLDRVTAELATAVELDGKMVVLCEALRDSLRLGPLRSCGARIATLNCVPDSNENIFVAEGHPAVLAELRKQLALDGRKLIELRPAAKVLYLAGVHIGEHLLIPWIAGAVASFRAAGFSRSEATRTIQSLGARALRAYGKAGVRACNPMDAERFRRAIEADIETIRRTDHRLAALCVESAERLLPLLSKPIAQAARGKRLAKVAALRAS